jgi:hypothetical protein
VTARARHSWLAPRVVAIGSLWIARTLAGLLVAIPIVVAISDSGMTNGPTRDAPLFQAGALALLELARTGSALLNSGLKTALVLAGSCAVLDLIPLAAVLDLLERADAENLGARLLRGVSLFPKFLGLSVITLLGQAALVLAGSLLGGALGAALHGQDERVATLLPIAIYALTLLFCICLGAVQDVARASAVERDLGARAALTEALTILRVEPLALLGGAYPSVAGSVCAWLASAWILGKIALGDGKASAIVLAFCVHQIAILLSVGLRVRWLGRALELGSRVDSARD